jgi:hypothetical protein
MALPRKSMILSPSKKEMTVNGVFQSQIGKDGS